eukprot:758364-Hanusia_phi.AAC.4
MKEKKKEKLASRRWSASRFSHSPPPHCLVTLSLLFALLTSPNFLVNNGNASLQREILSMKKGTRAVKLGEQELDKDAELLSAHQQKRAQLKRKKQTGELNLLRRFVMGNHISCRKTQTMWENPCLEMSWCVKCNVPSVGFTSWQGIAKQKQQAKAEREKEREREREKEAERERAKEQQKQELVRTEVGAIGWQEALDDYDDSDWLGVCECVDGESPCLTNMTGKWIEVCEGEQGKDPKRDLT